MYLLSIDQSTSGTKALLFDKNGDLIRREDLPHKQIINEKGWVEHDLNEIYANTLAVIKAVLEGVDKSLVVGIGISNQRETAAVWDKSTGEPITNAIVWQCARGADICTRLANHGPRIKEITGLNLSPYFTGAKIAWVIENTPPNKNLCAGTIDSWLIYKLTGNFKCDYSNASRTQLLDLHTGAWSEEVCELFGVDPKILPEICPSDSCFGYTNCDVFFDKAIPIYGVMGDSHAALFGQGCHSPGMMKVTYGTGSSVVMNIGPKPIASDNVVTSIAWNIGGETSYILEGNINYTGAIIKWLVDDLGIIESPNQAEEYAQKANPEDETYLVPAFTGLGAPYWESTARAVICGMSRTTGKAEIVKAALEAIGYQIADIIAAMKLSAQGLESHPLRVDGGPTRNNFLMQFQSDIINLSVLVPEIEELSGAGAAYMAGIALGVYDKQQLFSRIKRKSFKPKMNEETRHKKQKGWKAALDMVLTNKGGSI